MLYAEKYCEKTSGKIFSKKLVFFWQHRRILSQCWEKNIHFENIFGENTDFPPKFCHDFSQSREIVNKTLLTLLGNVAFNKRILFIECRFQQLIKNIFFCLEECSFQQIIKKSFFCLEELTLKVHLCDLWDTRLWAPCHGNVLVLPVTVSVARSQVSGLSHQSFMAGSWATSRTVTSIAQVYMRLYVLSVIYTCHAGARYREEKICETTFRYSKKVHRELRGIKSAVVGTLFRYITSPNLTM